MTTYEKLIQLLSSHNASYRIVEHEPEGKSEKIAKIRGNTLRQSAKAMLLTGKDSEGESKYFLAVLPGDMKVNFSRIAELAKTKNAKFIPVEKIEDLTGCVMGAIPPFSFDSRLKLMIDSRLLNENEEIVFNAGRLDRSLFLKTKDYISIISGDALITELAEHT